MAVVLYLIKNGMIYSHAIQVISTTNKMDGNLTIR